MIGIKTHFPRVWKFKHLRKNFIFLRFMEVWAQRVTCKVTVTLHGTRCVHTSMNLIKMKFISYIYTLFLHRFFVRYLWNVYLNLANKRRRKVIIRRVWLLRSTAVTMTWRQSNVTLANQQSCTYRENLIIASGQVWTKFYIERYRKTLLLLQYLFIHKG